MPCYLFTYHAHGSWMPDRSRGYVHRGQRVLTSDTRMAKCYRRNLRQTAVSFDGQIQSELLAGTRAACNCLTVRCHGIATDSSHVHLLVSWQSERRWESVSEAIKTSLSRRLNASVNRQKWFSKGASRKRVRDRAHFEYLMSTYLPDHRGLCWSERTARSQ